MAAANSALHHRNKVFFYIYKYLKVILNYNKISQYCSFTIFFLLNKHNFGVHKTLLKL